MTKAKYKNLIQKQLSALGIEGKNYDSVIDSLALILVQRDETRKEFEENGGKSVIEYTNKGGSTNMTKNPILVIWDELNKTALAYWRELGLTPSSYKKLTGDGVKKDTGQKGFSGTCGNRKLSTGRLLWSTPQASEKVEKSLAKN